MNTYYRIKLLGVLAVAAVSIWLAFPPKDKLVLGLDLQGGMQLVLQVDTGKMPEPSRSDVVERAVEILRHRIDAFGVQEPMISRQGNDRIVIQLPGITERQRALQVVGKAAHLEFRLTGAQLKDASVGFDEYGHAMVHLEFDAEGAGIFELVTSRNVGKRLAIVLDGILHSAPVIREGIPSGKAQISGEFTPDEAHDLALVLRAGSLPAPIKIVEERTVGPSLGRDSIEKGLRAALVGALLVFAFMPGYYLLAGWIADIGLIVYGIVVVGALAAFGAVLTLPGIAGFILSIGMAVDANVLISERIREEMDAGRVGRSAVQAGYDRAFSAILDSNLTTLLTSGFLFIFGTGPVKGFAVTLSIGIMASMFSALFVTRLIFDGLIHRNPRIGLRMFRLFGSASIPFLRRRFLAYGFSALTLALGFAGFVGRGQGAFGVEFVGGSLAQLRFQTPPDIARLREILSRSAAKSVLIQPFGAAGENQVVVRVSDADVENVESAARQVAGDGGYEVLQVERIGPTVSRDLRIKALWSVLLSAAGIAAYLAWRFDRVFAAAAAAALLHDALFTLGVFVFSGRELSLPILAALLTIMGYSVNDTIVTFDRVRENLKSAGGTDFQAVVEASINQTLSRTVLTSLTTLMCTAALYLFGGPAINDFAFTLLVGFSVGVYSTIFVAGALVVDMKGRLRHPRPRRQSAPISIILCTAWLLVVAA